MNAKQNEKQVVSQGPVQELKAERVQQEISMEGPFQMSLKAERVQEELAPAGVVGRASTVYELSFNQTRGVLVELPDLNVLIHIVPDSGLEAA